MKEKVLIIAEAGVNHNGDFRIAERLITAAKKAGADIVKFQTFQSEKIASKFAERAEYQKSNMKEELSQCEMLKKLELKEEDHIHLIKKCKKVKIRFLSTAFDFPSIDLLKRLGIKTWKIPSGEITNLPYLKKIGSFGQEIILSTGMAKLGEVEDAIGVLVKAGTPRSKIIVLHCSTEYPTPMKDVNLRAMLGIRDALGVKVGYSDHTPGIEVAVAAVALGACVIEKHFTTDRNLPGPDHKASLEPDELEKMVASIRNIEAALGNGVKAPCRSEIKNIPIVRKSIVASKRIRAGEKFSASNLAVKRPGSGISPMNWENISGRKAIRDFQKDELIEI